MENILSKNVRRICKERKLSMKELARRMGVDPAALTRALSGNARLDTIQKIATSLEVSLKSLLEPQDDVEGFIRVGGQAYQFNSRNELEKLLNRHSSKKTESQLLPNGNWSVLDGLKYARTYCIEDFKKEYNVELIQVKVNPQTGKLFFVYNDCIGWVATIGIPQKPVISIVSNKYGIFFPLLHEFEDIGKVSFRPAQNSCYISQEDYGNDWKELMGDAFEGDESNYWNID